MVFPFLFSPHIAGLIHSTTTTVETKREEVDYSMLEIISSTLSAWDNILLISYEALYVFVLATFMVATHANRSNFYVAARQPQLLQMELCLNAFINLLFGEYAMTSRTY